MSANTQLLLYNIGRERKPTINSSYKQFSPGSMFKFVHAPGRWKGEDPREPAGLLGKTGIVIDGPFHDFHQWGGIFDVLSDGKAFQYYGDFMEIIE